MQHIAVLRETETGQLLAQFDPNGLDIRIVKATPSTSLCLRFIDPYGDLVINQIQLPVLIGELQDFRASSTEPDLREHLDRLIRFLQDSAEIHVYIRFAGD